MLTEGIMGLCKFEMASTAITLERDAQIGPVCVPLQSFSRQSSQTSLTLAAYECSTGLR